MGSKFGTDGKFLKQYNNYDLSGEYGIGYLFNCNQEKRIKMYILALTAVTALLIQMDLMQYRDRRDNND